MQIFHHLRLRIILEGISNNLTKLIHDNGIAPVGICKDMPEQRGLASTKVASDDDDGNTGHM